MKHKFILVPHGLMENEKLDFNDQRIFMKMTSHMQIDGFIDIDKKQFVKEEGFTEREIKESIDNLVAEGFIERISKSNEIDKLKFNYPDDVLRDMYNDLVG